VTRRFRVEITETLPNGNRLIATVHHLSVDDMDEATVEVNSHFEKVGDLMSKVFDSRQHMRLVLEGTLIPQKDGETHRIVLDQPDEYPNFRLFYQERRD
jgi:hypothetical protein